MLRRDDWLADRHLVHERFFDTKRKELKNVACSIRSRILRTQPHKLLTLSYNNVLHCLLLRRLRRRPQGDQGPGEFSRGARVGTRVVSFGTFRFRSTVFPGNSPRNEERILGKSGRGRCGRGAATRPRRGCIDARALLPPRALARPCAASRAGRFSGILRLMTLYTVARVLESECT